MWYSTSGISPQVSVCFNLPFLQRRFLHCACKTENKLQNKIMYFSLKAKYYKDYRSHPYIIASGRPNHHSGGYSHHAAPVAGCGHPGGAFAGVRDSGSAGMEI